ncbi:Mucin-associated surface protein (MASP) [Trypanosoma cruzi]|uniref:Mucin-associated surface protein (MASP), putative n=2 Tax=Trypanosoma cruzi TaxID=5693 RepID=Q4D6E5_TRYCC|nr:mucin-associated surface protein (MASP), putative [Trypanosoma cruzi]EAN88099.1 mucin-associated surface protein (MASP), putative [Trypanosoma cruzi]PWU92814.1 Mucin-associated surface protein (MASP) [Trypanosoma cruzi]RNC52773.1 mucin-associated surface protein (MASP) [Trypanosoma cruzi]|eukprot:XP_809950.1 mucin-associated surface protein (MASP) [Trypanosoma cruzi strain CL Brener]
MAMMMTGRVLLVCALCVLWCCGAVLTVVATDDFIIDENTEQKMVLLWYNIYNKECEEKNKENGSLNDSAMKSCMRTSMKEICGVFYNDTSGETPDPESDRICKEYTGDPVEAAESSTPQDKPSPGAETPVAAPTPETSKDEAEEMGLTPGIPAGDSPAKPTEGPPLPSAAIDAASNETQKGITEVMPKNAPESNATRKEEEEKRNERNHNNTKTTPLDADAMQRITSSADSDSSTAVSHATSPFLLLLLLLVACAAAAAVVAA